MRQQCGLGQRQLAHRAQVTERGALAVALQELAVLGERRLRLVAEREERLLGAEPRPGLHQGHHFVRRQRVGAGLARVAPERAVPAVVPAQRGQRHEHLGRERHRPPAPAIPHLARAGQELRQPRRRAFDQRARFQWEITAAASSTVWMHDG